MSELVRVVALADKVFDDDEEEEVEAVGFLGVKTK